MTSENAREVIHVRDPLPVVLELMGALGISVHGNQAGVCVVCGSA